MANVLPQTYVMELSQRSADIVHENKNGDYTSHFSEPITLKAGDELAMRMASIDSQRSDSESVVISEPGMHLSMMFSYFDNNYQIEPSTAQTVKYQYGNVASAYTPNYKVHATYVGPGLLQLNSFEVKYEGGKPNGLGESFSNVASMISMPQFSWIDREGNHQQNTGSIEVVSAGDAFTNGKFGIPSGKSKDPYQYVGVNPGDGTDGKWEPFIVTEAKDNIGGSAALFTGGTTGFPYPYGYQGDPIIFKKGSLSLNGMIGFTLINNQLDAFDKAYTLINNVGSSFKSTGNQNTVVVTDPQAKISLFKQTEGILIAPGRYDRSTLAQIITQKFTEVGLTSIKEVGGNQTFAAGTNLVFRANQDPFSDVLFREIPDEGSATDLTFDATNSYVYNQGAGANSTVQVGARKFAIEYGVTGNTFQVTAAHQAINQGVAGTGTPPTGGSEGKDQIAYFYEAGPPIKYTEVLAATGIVVHSLLDDTGNSLFWKDVLGLYDNWITPTHKTDGGIEYYTLQDFAGKTTAESAQISVFDQTNFRGGAYPTANTFFDTTALPTKAIIGDSPKVNASTGAYYMLEITGLNLSQSNYIDDSENRANVSAIISKQYDQNDTVTGFADSAIPYVHRGMPVKVSGARVRILDPISKSVVPTLGPENTVMLQVSTTAQVYVPPNAQKVKQAKNQNAPSQQQLTGMTS